MRKIMTAIFALFTACSFSLAASEKSGAYGQVAAYDSGRHRQPGGSDYLKSTAWPEPEDEALAAQRSFRRT
ncbi:hypothetical protein [Thalassomonas haliotis]|uniref:Uncharacterized protein n=1 Tax=Thalassomonas haliotis TaxID=485448 RepID=A0ABY7VFB3_9GAMM|nr:hypothetical protein [Thalassomonas haliotis]WDE11829.1 hypothetical protein H3N35_27180 [Thalassomonas haliotis]